MGTQSEAGGSVLDNILFSGIEDKVFLKRIEKSLERKTLKASTTLFRQGDKVDGLYLIFSGQVQIYIQRDGERYTLSHAEKNHLVGEFLLQGNSDRSVSAEVIKDSALYFLSSVTLNQLIEEYPQSGALLSGKIVNRLCWNQTILALHMCHLFAGLNEKAIRLLLNEMDIISVASDTLLIKQYDASDALYVVIEGRFQVYHQIDSTIKELNMVGRGASVGEMGVISQSPRSANVRAVRDSTVARLSRASYEKILKAYPVEISQTFVKSVINHLSDTNTHQSNAAETFVFADLSATKNLNVIQQLVDALAKFGPATFLTSEKVNAAFSQQGVAQTGFDDGLNHALLQWLAEQEIAHRYVIYVTDTAMSHWSQRCLRQADQVLFLVDAQADNQQQILEKPIITELKNKRIKQTLLLKHFETHAVPLNSALWLTGNHFNNHHHVREGVKTDFNRVARFLTGNTIGVVFGGGGARGFAHVGVIRAFKALNIPIDRVGGNSMGAVIAAQYAMQWGTDEMVNKTRAMCLKGDRLTLPVVSLFSGKKMTKGLRQMFGDRDIEDLWLHYFSVSCNISRATVMTHKSGSLLAAVLNSNAPPGLFPPQVVDGDLLVDGALLNNVPVDVMAKMNRGGEIIAVDVNAREDLLNNIDRRGGESGWKLLFNKLNPWADKIYRPGLIEILSRSSIIGGLAQRKKGMKGIADLYLQPPVNHFPLMAYKQAEQIEEVGYRYAMQALQKWLDEGRKVKGTSSDLSNKG